MTRAIDTGTLDNAARFYASLFLTDRAPKGRDWVMEQFHNFTFKDEFEHLCSAIGRQLGSDAAADFKARAKRVFDPREDKVFHDLLAEKLAIDPKGEHIPGQIGTTQVGRRRIGIAPVTIETPDSLLRRRRLGLPKSERQVHDVLLPHHWPIYAGEGHERAAGGGAADLLPPGAEPLPLSALNTRISAELAIAMVDQVTLRLDEGTGAAVLQGRTGAQPADPDAIVGGTLLFTLVCNDPAFPAGVDAAPGGRITANTITDDPSADATGTLSYIRASATNDGATPIDDHIDGECGVGAGFDFDFSTLAIVAGAAVSSTWVVTQPQS